MPNPKHRISKARRDKRRTHYKATAPTLGIDPTTGEAHILHRAHWSEDKLYYRGKVVFEKASK
ncbi:MAG: 50S ribosomal protein L32 [Chitinophagales bacterium]|nr:50S ribosomal protein L32 [Chitinophagales bacterium]MDW8273906.1 50S ribosomal protein L32 [Chitinophagales bacterium]